MNTPLKCKDGDEPEGPIECRAAVAITALDKNEIVFLPIGLHAITPVEGGIGRPIKVLVDAAAAAEVEKQRGAISARTGKRVYFDFNHEDGPASFWPDTFTWRANEGVVAKGEWSTSGKNAVQGKDYRAFSPVFYVDDKRKDPSRVVCREDARVNMGGLVNDPAFSNLPLWAKNDGSPVSAGANASDTTTKEKVKMTPEEIAALQAKNEEQKAKIAELEAIVARNTDDDSSKSQLEKYRVEARNTELELEAEKLRSANRIQAKEIEKRNKETAEVHVSAAVKRGAIAPKNLQLRSELVAKATVDPTFISIIDGMVGTGDAITDRISRSPIVGGGSGVTITGDDPVVIYAKMAKLLQNSARAGTHEEKARIALDVGAIYAGAFSETEKNKDIRNRLVNSRLDIVQEAIMAADVTDANLGTIAGTLVTLRTLELLKFKFPALVRFTTDFSDQPATYLQTIMTRIVTIPSVVTYSTATGWADVVAATTDVPVIINNHKGVPITFNENLLASSMRRLFEEFSEASAYALAKAMVDSLYLNLTDANFTNNTISTSAAFTRNAVVDIGTALELRGVPLGLGTRTMLLWPNAFGSVKKDATMVQFSTNVPQPSIITEGTQPDTTLGISVDSFQLYSAPNLPSNNANLIGFAGSKSALCIATRTPNDYTSVLPGASFGNVQMVTDPDIGITVMQVQYVNHTLGTATSRIALMWGTAPGQTAAGQLIKAASGTGSAR
jgi:Mu-like prophage I protein